MINSDDPISLSNNQSTKATPSTSPQINDSITETFWDVGNDNNSNTPEQTDVSKYLPNDMITESPSMSLNAVVDDQSQSTTTESAVEQQDGLHTNSIINNNVTNNEVKTSNDDTQKNDDNFPVMIANLASMSPSDEVII